ncbi:DOG1 domain-containing protein [Artemisia annua]|uniref:DOG1 domain-containing protein n=1 Tax=Artemisia annua TaxID=35608 RepID=A0A2U1LJR3_ARTAN|nr:DOG1 domain-containing protein [Artemisia annua]
MTNTTPIEEKFSDFYEKWVCQLEEYLRFLVQDYSHESDYENLVAKLTTHHKNYYRFKWAAAHEDVCAFFTPVWLTPLENAYLWVTGWKPSVVFRFLTALEDLSEEQVKKIEGLKVKIKMEEQKVEREMERQQVSMADRRTVEIVTCGGADVAAVLSGLERVMKMGDCVRLKTLKGLLDLMSPKQSVELLAAQAMFHVQLRKWGKKLMQRTSLRRKSLLSVRRFSVSGTLAKEEGDGFNSVSDDNSSLNPKTPQQLKNQLEEYLRFLVQDYSHESDYENLVAKLTTHHKNYYRFKWAAAHEDVCAFFTPVWLTPLENAYLWVTGWKPSVVFRFLTALEDLSEEQVKKIEGLKVKIKMEEQKVEREMERQQVSMADRRTVEIVTCGGADVAAVLSGLERVMKMGDCVRLKTLKGLLDLMSPKQSVELLAAQAMFHVQLRKWGKKL